MPVLADAILAMGTAEDSKPLRGKVALVAGCYAGSGPGYRDRARPGRSDCLRDGAEQPGCRAL